MFVLASDSRLVSSIRRFVQAFKVTFRALIFAARVSEMGRYMPDR